MSLLKVQWWEWTKVENMGTKMNQIESIGTKMKQSQK